MAVYLRMWFNLKPPAGHHRWLSAQQASELLREHERLLDKRMNTADLLLYDSRSQQISVLIDELSTEPERSS